MKLNHFHIIDSALGSIHHSDTISRSNQWVGRVFVDLPQTSSRQQGTFRQPSFHLFILIVVGVNTVTFNVRCDPGNGESEVMLGN